MPVAAKEGAKVNTVNLCGFAELGLTPLSWAMLAFALACLFCGGFLLLRGSAPKDDLLDEDSEEVDDG